MSLVGFFFSNNAIVLESTFAKIFLSYMAFRTSGLLQAVTYNCISISRMLLFVSPAKFHTLSIPRFQILTWVMVVNAYVIDLLLRVTVYSETNCDVNLAGMRLHKLGFSYNKKYEEGISTENLSQNLTFADEEKFQNLSLAYKELRPNITLGVDGTKSPCAVFPMMTIFLMSFICLEIVRTIAGVLATIKKIRKANRKIESPGQPPAIFEEPKTSMLTNLPSTATGNPNPQTQPIIELGTSNHSNHPWTTLEHGSSVTSTVKEPDNPALQPETGNRNPEIYQRTEGIFPIVKSQFIPETTLENQNTALNLQTNIIEVESINILSNYSKQSEETAETIIINASMLPQNVNFNSNAQPESNPIPLHGAKTNVNLERNQKQESLFTVTTLNYMKN